MTERNDEQIIRDAYIRMYEGMIKKDESILREVLDDSFVLVHMTGMRQPKQAFIKAVLNGQSYVAAAVFGGGRHNWHLQQKCSLKKADGVWKITRSVASTY